MDHWGDDPWADGKSPTKQEVTTPPPQHSTFTPAPVLLNGFLDDAQWGSNEDQAFGGWATSPRKPDTASEPRVDERDVVAGWEDDVEDRSSHSDIQEEDGTLPERNEWSQVEEAMEQPRAGDNVVSETSDSATTIQPDDAPAPTAKDSAEPLYPDDDLSTRPSTSPSDTSRNEAAAESPRTSFEEEQAAEKATDKEHVKQDGSESEKRAEGSASERIQVESGDPDDTFGDFEDDVVRETGDSPPQAESLGQPADSPLQDIDESAASPTRDEATKLAPVLTAQTGESGSDQDLLSQLFAPTKSMQELKEAPVDPVHSTSTRKAWYRLSRKQTMREYNSSNVDDNYIRVTWKTSHIRTEVIKTVSRWANEDRMAGRGPGARASFYWNTLAPPNQQDPFHPRKKSTISVSNPTRLAARQSVQPLATDVPAAFNWSSPSVGHDPWKDSTTDTRAVSSRVAPPKHSTVAKLQRQEGRPVSVDLTRPKEPASHKRTLTNIDLNGTTPAPSPSPIEPLKPPADDPADPWARLGALDTNPLSQQDPPATEDDGDEWGEMVESPAVSSAQTPIADITEFPEPTTRNNTLSTPSTTPKSVKAPPLQPIPLSSGSKYASPIVRLKGTVSPTSALFKANAFVPAGVEDGPIGPGLLKARNRSAASTPEKSRTPPQPVAQLDEVLHCEIPKTTVEEDIINTTTTVAENDEFSAFETSLPSLYPDPPSPTTPSAPPSSPPPVQQFTDTWADADLSIFDAVVPTSNPTPPPPPQQIDATDPWSSFDTPAPSQTSSPQPPVSQTPFTRTPPRPVTPPPKQPLTSATSSAQKRKANEDDLIRSIIDGLPNLSYMLRR